MNILAGILIVSLYEVSKKLFDKGFDAAWEPVGDSLKVRFAKWAGTDEESKRKAAFAALTQVAVERTIAKANDRTQAQRILELLLGLADKKVAEALAHEAGKLMLISDQPDVDQMVVAASKHLRLEVALKGGDLPAPEVMAVTFTDFLAQLRGLLLDKQLDLGQKEIILQLRKIVGQLQPDLPDLAALERDYLTKMVEKHELLTMQGISPKVQNKTIGIKMENVFIPLKARDDDVYRERPKVLRRIKEWLVKRGDFTLEQLEEVKETVLVEHIQDKGAMETLYAEFNPRFRNYLDHIFESQEIVDVGQTEQRQPDIVVAMDSIFSHSKVVIQGDPGSGKSTLTRFLCWKAANTYYSLDDGEESKLPVRIRAIEFGDDLEKGKVTSLEDYLLRDGGRFAPLIDYHLISGKVVVMIDGLDEVQEVKLRQRVKEETDDFFADPIFNENQAVITTRIVGYERSGLTGSFRHFTLNELDETQITTFVGNWYRAIYEEMPDTLDVEQEQGQLLDSIFQTPSILRMARNPLLLTIIALIKWQGRTLPDQRVLLYDVATQTLIRSWPLTQRYVELDELFIREWLAPVALHIFKDSTTDLIDEFTLEELLVESMQRLKSLPELEAKSKSRELLESVTQHSGVLLPRGTDIDGRNLYGFLHQTFAEYFTAFYMAGLWEDGELQLADYAHKPYWQEVLMLMAGHLGIQRRAKAGKFIKALRNLRSTEFENVIHQDLLLACTILSDGVPAGPGDFIETLLRDLLLVYRDSKISFLIRDVEFVLEKFLATEYRSSLARIIEGLAFANLKLVKLLDYIDLLKTKDLINSLINSKSFAIRLQAMRWLETQAAGRVFDTMVDLLEDEAEIMQLRAARWLGASADKRGVDTMLNLLEAESEDVRLRAASWLADRDDGHGEETIVALLEAESDNVRWQAARWLADREDGRGVDTMVDLLEAESEDVQFDAARWLADRDDGRGDDTMVALLKAESADVRLQVAKWLEVRDERREGDSMASLLQDESEYVRLEAAFWLLERDDGRGDDALMALLESKSDNVRLAATILLAERDDRLDVDTKVASLQDGDEIGRLAAAVWLAERDDRRGLETIFALLEADTEIVQWVAASWLAVQDKYQILNQRSAPFKMLLSNTNKIDYNFSLGQSTVSSLADFAYYIAQSYLRQE